MAISFDRVNAGDILYDVHRTRMGNTTVSRLGWWPVRVIEINHGEGWAMVSWNHNAPKRYSRRQIEKLRKSIPKALREKRS